MIEFVKMHGTGNDFVVIPDLDNRYELTAEAAELLCQQHFGIGADGAIRIGSDDQGRFFMDYRNADGSVAEMCGNGVRVVGKWLGDRGHAVDVVELATRAGVKKLTFTRGLTGLIEQVSVDMGAPVGDVLIESIEGPDEKLEATIVSMGNPHAVIFVDDVDDAEVERVGAFVETSPRFPEGTNVEFVDRRGHSVRQRTWERGVGETLACGTGACAVAVAAVTNGHTVAGSNLPIALRGGMLQLVWTPGESVRMTGPASQTFSGTFDPARYGIHQR